MAEGAGEAAVRQAFRDQEDWSEKLGSPFMARLCGAFADGLDRGTAIGARILDWPGHPDTLHDAVPLRIAGGLHALVRRGHSPDLARLYPPNALPSAADLWGGIVRALDEHEAALMPWLDGAPQTNEVARSSLLMAGFLEISAATGLPLSLLELGASAGLNLLSDRYRHRLGELEVGPDASALRLAPPWEGPAPARAEVRIAARRGVDLNPLDMANAADRERLPCYVWPDQAERLARVEAAIAIAAQDPPTLDRGDAAGWLEERLAETPPRGIVRVVYHTIAFQYFPTETQARIEAALDRAGATATPETPLARLAFEADPGRGALLKLRLWPDGRERVLARSDGHVKRVVWLAE